MMFAGKGIVTVNEVKLSQRLQMDGTLENSVKWRMPKVQVKSEKLLFTNLSGKRTEQ